MKAKRCITFIRMASPILFTQQPFKENSTLPSEKVNNSSQFPGRDGGMYSGASDAQEEEEEEGRL